MAKKEIITASQFDPDVPKLDSLENAGPYDTVTVWFNDGNLIVRAGKSTFRVYRGILTAASSVFRDMVLLAKEGFNGGCPFVCVSDAAADVSFFLMSLHDPEFFLPPPAKTTFAVAADILRLSTKYDVPFLRRRALHHLSAVYPTTLPDWDASHEWLSPSINGHFSAIGLARQYDIAWIRPMAVYRCMSKPISQTYEVFQQTELSEEDRKICTSVMPKLKASEIICLVSALSAASGKSSKCRTCSSLGCGPGLLAGNAFANTARSESADPLATKDVLREFTLCSHCSSVSRSQHDRQRVSQWNAIPDMVQCPSWEDLSKMKAATLS